MLKKGQVYKATYNVDVDGDYAQRNNMIISPSYDIDLRNFIVNRKMLTIRCLFHINLGNYVCRDMNVGVLGITKIERPNTKEDFDDISKAMEICGLTYNKQWNRIEGYERGMGGMFRAIK